MTKAYIRTAFIASAFALAAAPHALASGWTPAEGQDATSPRTIYAETDTGVALLSCPSAGKFVASLSNDSQNFANRLKRNAPYRRGVDVVITVGDVANDPESWMLVPAKGIIFSPSHNQAAKIFNATVRGEPVSVTVDGDDYVTITPPAIDETFRAFNKTCRN